MGLCDGGGQPEQVDFVCDGEIFTLSLVVLDRPVIASLYMKSYTNSDDICYIRIK